MFRPCLLFVFGLVSLASSGVGWAGQSSDWSLKLEIPSGLPTAVGQPAGPLLRATLTNTSGRSLTILDADEGSKGHDSISFLVTEPNGRSFQMTQSRRGWIKNAQVAVVIPPNGTYVFDRYLLDPNWSWFGTPADFQGGTVTIQARFEIVKAREPIWTGVVLSNKLQVTLGLDDVAALKNAKERAIMAEKAREAARAAGVGH